MAKIKGIPLVTIDFQALSLSSQFLYKKQFNMDQNAPIEDLAGRMYDRYCKAVGGIAFNGEPLPNWAEFGSDANKTKQANGWREAAKEALGIE